MFNVGVSKSSSNTTILLNVGTELAVKAFDIIVDDVAADETPLTVKNK